MVNRFYVLQHLLLYVFVFVFFFIFCLLFIFYSLSFFNSSIMFSIEWQIDKRTGGLMDGQTSVSFKQARLKKTNTTTAKKCYRWMTQRHRKIKNVQKIDNHYNDCNNNSRFSLKKIPVSLFVALSFRFFPFLFLFLFQALFWNLNLFDSNFCFFFVKKKLQQNYQHN